MEGGASVDGDAEGKGFIKPTSSETVEVWENLEMQTVVRIALRGFVMREAEEWCKRL
jgi:hypothetical protein